MRLKRGKFIVIEGIDGSGKATHTRLLAEFLKERVGEKRLLTIGFPRYYSSGFGKLVGDFLSGKFGRFKDVSPYLTVLPYMLDEYAWSRDVGRPWIESGGYILSDRYFSSNVHQIAKLKTKAKSDYRRWLWPTGWEELGILKPDLIIFLDRSPVDSSRLNKYKELRRYIKGKKKSDLAERDFGHQVEAYREYLRTVRDNKSWWVSVRCPTTKNVGEDTIFLQEEIRKIVKRRLL